MLLLLLVPDCHVLGYKSLRNRLQHTAMLKACLAAAGMHKLQSNIQQSVAIAVVARSCDRLLLCSQISLCVLVSVL